MVRWQLTRVQGQLGPLTAKDVLAGGALPVDGQGQARMEPVVDATGPETLLARVRPWLDPALAGWVILPHGERQRRRWWQAALGDRVEIGFGRAAVALAISQLNRLQTNGRLLAVHVPEVGCRGVEAVIALDWTPAREGLSFDFVRMDGRLDGQTDVGALLDEGRAVVAQPEVFFAPGSASEGDTSLDQLKPFLAHLGPWAGQDVRWVFAEAGRGSMGVAGGLFTWAWLEAGYRLGEWSGPAVVLDMDDGPLVGLTVASWVGPVLG